MLKDEQDCSYNGGGAASPLKTRSDFSYIHNYRIGCKHKQSFDQIENGYNIKEHVKIVPSILS